MGAKVMMLAGLGSALGVGAVLAASAAMAPLANAAPAKAAAACPGGDTGITLPPGFCATIFADNLGNTRHIVVAADGTLYANTWNGSSYFRGTTGDPAGFLIAVEDANHDGKGDRVTHFGMTPAEGSKGGTGIGLYKGAVFAEMNDKIMRYPLSAGSDVPSAKPRWW